ncbi:MAG TPA: MBL fold metallo-hydrolase [Candidatus Acidoferrales bacterium]|nr:MBL fold metallo-hydrolase [Candidatus Acidoferrales bacterium]
MRGKIDRSSRSDREGLGRRQFLTGVAGFAALGAAAGLGAGVGGVGVASAQTSVVPTGQNGAALAGTHVILLGTRGGPGVDLARNETASAVVVDGVPYLVDCGYGTVRSLVACGLGYAQIATIFFTHLHNDHTSDLAALLTHQWTGGRTKPTDVYGPYGTAAMVEGALAFFKADTEIRIVDEGRTTRPESLFHGHDLAATDKPVPAFKDERVSVTSAENTHFPERSKAKMPYRSLAYRFDSANRSIVFAGDTAYSRNLVDLARGADVFICEVMDQAIHDEMAARAKAEADKGNPDNIYRHVADTHSTPADVGRMASEAQVKLVVLNHLVPGTTPAGRPEFPVTSFIDAVRKVYPGEVIVGQDLMVI